MPMTLGLYWMETCLAYDWYIKISQALYDWQHNSVTRCWNKKQPNILRKVHKSSQISFTFNVRLFKIAQKVAKNLSYFSN